MTESTRTEGAPGAKHKGCYYVSEMIDNEVEFDRDVSSKVSKRKEALSCNKTSCITLLV